MDANVYFVEKYTESKLAEARADAARATLLASLRRPRSGALAVVGSALIWIGHKLRRRDRVRRHARLPLPSPS